jgi:hypothetical protein
VSDRDDDFVVDLGLHWRPVPSHGFRDLQFLVLTIPKSHGIALRALLLSPRDSIASPFSLGTDFISLYRV